MIRHLPLWLHYLEGITCSSPQISSLLGFKGVRDGTGYHIGKKQGSSKHRTFTTQDFVADYPVDLRAGTQLKFIYVDINHNQIVRDPKAPLLRVIDTVMHVQLNRIIVKCLVIWTLKSFCSTKFLNFLLICAQSGGNVPFAGGGKVVLILKFQKFSN